MARASVQHLHVDVGLRALREPFEEVLDELRLQIADAADLEPQIDDRVDAPAQIDRRHRQRLVHRHHEVSGAVDAAAVAERRRHRLAERDADVLDGVMLIDVEIPLRVQLQVERAVTGDELQHVIQEPDPGPHVVAPLAVEREPERDRRFRRDPVDGGPPHRTSSSAASSACVCSITPAVMRRQPAHPGSRRSIAHVNAARREPGGHAARLSVEPREHEVGGALPVRDAAPLEKVVEHRLRLRDLIDDTSRSTRCRRGRPAARPPRTR